MMFLSVTHKSATLVLVLGALFGSASAASVDVNYSISGSAGDWVLDFNVANNIADKDQNIYFFGVALDDSKVIRGPSAFDYTTWTEWNNSQVGGSDINYNDNFLDNTFVSGIYAGTQQGGFAVHTATHDAPTSVHWFAYSAGDQVLNDTDSFFKDKSSYGGFEGTALPVPEPAPLALLAGGLLMLAVPRLRRGRNAR